MTYLVNIVCIGNRNQVSEKFSIVILMLYTATAPAHDDSYTFKKVTTLFNVHARIYIVKTFIRTVVAYIRHFVKSPTM